MSFIDDLIIGERYPGVASKGVEELIRRRFPTPRQESLPKSFTRQQRQDVILRETLPAEGGLIGGLTDVVVGRVKKFFGGDDIYPIAIHGRWTGPLFSGNRRMSRGDVLTVEDLEVNPTDDLDAISKAHDIMYALAGSEKDEIKRKNAYKLADKIYVDKVDNMGVDYFMLAIDSLWTLYNIYTTTNSIIDIYNLVKMSKTLNANIEGSQAQVADINKRLKQINRERITLENDKRTLLIEATTNGDQTGRIAQELTRIEASLREKELDLTGISNSLDELRALSAPLDEKSQELNRNLNQLITDRDNAREAIAEVVEKVADIDRSGIMERSELKYFIKPAWEKVMNAQDDEATIEAITKLRKKIMIQQKQEWGFVGASEKWFRERKQFLDQIDSLISDINRGIFDMKHRQKYIDDIAPEIQRIAKEIQALREEKLPLIERRDAVEAAKIQTEAARAQALTVQTQLETEKQNLQTRLETLNTNLSAIERDISAKREFTNVKGSEIDALNAEIARIKTDLSDVEEKLPSQIVETAISTSSLTERVISSLTSLAAAKLFAKRLETGEESYYTYNNVPPELVREYINKLNQLGDQNFVTEFNKIVTSPTTTTIRDDMMGSITVPISSLQKEIIPTPYPIGSVETLVVEKAPSISTEPPEAPSISTEPTEAPIIDEEVSPGAPFPDRKIGGIDREVLMAALEILL